MWGRIFNLVLKEFLQLRRDRQARFRLLIPPLIQMIIFGYAATFEVYHVSTAVLDPDHSQESRELISRFEYSGRFRIVETAKTPAEIRRAIDQSDAVVAIVIQAGFAEELRKGVSAPAQIIVDGTTIPYSTAPSRSPVGSGLAELPGRLPPHAKRHPGGPALSCSSTSASAGRSPTAASITSQTRSTVPTAASKPPTTVPIPPSNASLTLWQPLEF